ncbi:MAG: hypothetical protein KME46_08615 [Brasilonema angustatum HA4187-MV1]|jgi:hypothetical protein|nr:hypothetical protein [Brasilonema angustatum HA4187-MV1]
MESQDSICDDFLKRFLLQGKIISQIITFWWRYDDNEKATGDDPKKIEIAKLLGEYFFPNEPASSPGRLSPSQFLIELFKTESRLSPSPSLIDLFKADPRLHINEENPEKSVEVLITIFGRDRISNKETYLSPIFNSTELGLNNRNNLARYEFEIDINGTRFGKLTDPRIIIENDNSLLKYIYIIPIPPRPRIDNMIYEQWISNENDNYPPNQLIPFTT